MAQKYEVDCLVGPEIKAIPVEKPTEYDGSRTVLYIANGTLVDVVGRTVTSPDGRTASHLGDVGDSVDVRQIKGIIHYDGRRYLVEARWLKFADENPPSATDRFASDNFRPRLQLTSWLAMPRLDVHSASTRMLYSRWLPFMALLLMFLAVWMTLRTRFLVLSALPFFAAVGIVIYMALMIDWDALWWCNPDYVGIKKCHRRHHPRDVVYGVGAHVSLVCDYFYQSPAADMAPRDRLYTAVARHVGVCLLHGKHLARPIGMLWHPRAYQWFAPAPLWCRHDPRHAGRHPHLCSGIGHGGPGFAVDYDGHGPRLAADSLAPVDHHRQIPAHEKWKMGAAQWKVGICI